MKCTICSNEIFVKAGFIIGRKGTFQRYLCKKCGHMQKGELILPPKI